jgi:glycosyltransferase involved in cell wall biosynthesis
MRATIVTPVLNGRRFLAETLASVRRQDLPDLEHVVVDGGSTDGTLDLLSSSEGVRWISEPDGGLYDAVNKGFRMATGEVLGYLNADDRYLPQALATAIAVFRERSDADVVYGDYALIDDQGRPLGTRRVTARPFSLARLRRSSCVPPHSAFVRRRVLDQGHWLDRRLRLSADWDWFLGMAERGKCFVQVHRVLSEFRIHPDSITQRLPWRAILAEWRLVCRARRVSLTRLVWHEVVVAALRRRMGLPP